MKTRIPKNCGNSPRSLLAIEIAINLASNKYDELEPILAEDFMLSTAGNDEGMTRSELRPYMEKAAQSNTLIEKFDIVTSFSHGKYAAVSTCACMSDGTILNSHDLYVFTGAGAFAKLHRVVVYPVDSRL